MKYNKYLIGDICNFIDYRGKTPPKTSFGIPLITAKIIKNGIIQEPQEFIDEALYDEWMRRGIPKKGDVIFTTEAPLGEVAKIKTNEKMAFAQRVIILEPNNSILDSDYLFYALQDRVLKGRIEARSSGTTVFGIKAKELKKVEIQIPSMEIQRKIGSILSSIDDKIETNTAINKNLEEQALAIYREMFVDTNNSTRKACMAKEYFDIAIGKTPPRKEHQWFSKDPTNVTWVSISDMGNCGVFISKSSEYLTQKAVDKFNIKVIPDNTVILSFKLTVGRVAITQGKMTTNEAIAHFRTDDIHINEYLYCYLKEFNYRTMGSTSSIATAVNSKIIKSMPFIVPEHEELMQFHSMVAPVFGKIRKNQNENYKLSEIRDVLLPRLMSGEIDVSDIEI